MENSTSNSLPSKLEVTGVWRDDQEVGRALEDHFYGNETTHPFISESLLTPERSKQLIGLGLAFTELGSDLGLDLHDRIPAPDKYHFFETRESFDACMISMGVPTEETLDAMTLANGIFILDRGDDFTNVCIAAHETVHYLAQKKVGTGGGQAENGSKDVRIKGVRQGYKYQKSPGNETFQGLDEIATEITYLHLLNGGYWDRQPDLPRGGDRNPTFYTSLDIIGDELILAAAKDAEVDPLSVVQGIEIDVLTGKSDGLRVVTDYIRSSVGLDGVRELTHAPNADTEGKFKQLANDLNLPGAMARIEGLEHGKPAEVLTWMKHRG